AVACDHMVPVGPPMAPRPLPDTLRAAQCIYADLYPPLVPAMHSLSALEAATPASTSTPAEPPHAAG
ncbi:MAG: hypothetical protein ACK5ZV_07185, partial [bacterium]